MKLTKAELHALARRALDQLLEGLAHDDISDCPLHGLSKEERAELIDKAIDDATEEFRKKAE